jgi:hypothetical protein
VLFGNGGAYLRILFFVLLSSVAAAAQGAPEYHIYSGSTHAHSAYTWSHGEQWAANKCKGVRIYGARKPEDPLRVWKEEFPNGPPTEGTTPCFTMFVINDVSIPSSDMKLRPDWTTVQGPPAVHFEKAKAAGFDFYVMSDHSQEAGFAPADATNPTWVQSKKEAIEATDANFVAISGFEFSENDGPGGVGHINVINADALLNALSYGVDLPYFYKWLPTAKPIGQGPIVASFNHPGAHQYADFADRTPDATEIITMLEVINSNTHIHYEGFINALDHGWKVSPVAGNDNHGLTGITKQKSRTFVLAISKTKVAILDAMKNRRIYASLDNNIQCRYTVNGAIMGSTLVKPDKSYHFHVWVSDPDTSDPRNKITKMDIVKDGGAVVQTWTADSPDYKADWSPTVEDDGSHFYFVRIWSAGGGDAPTSEAAKPMTWLAPVWTGRTIGDPLPSVIPMPGGTAGTEAGQ